MGPVLTGIFIALDPTRITPIAGAQMISQGRLCADENCLTGADVELPWFSVREMEAGLIRRDLIFEIPFAPSPDAMSALYLPKFSDNIAITLNGTAIRQTARFERHWNMPLILPVPSALFHDGGNVLRLTLEGYAQQALELQPFYIGPREALTGSFNVRHIIVTFVPRFALGVMILLAAVFMTIWLGQRREMVYLYLALSCVTAAILSIHFGFDTGALPYKVWMILWGYATPVYVLLIGKIVRYHLRLDPAPAERYFPWLLGTFIISAFAVPEGWIHAFVVQTNLATALGAAMLCAWFWLHRNHASRVDFIIMFGCMSVAALLGNNVLYMLIWPEPRHSLNFYQFMPIVMTGMCLWLIVSRLLQSLSDHEALARSQQKTIAAKATELEDSYKRLAAMERRRAIEDERQRIMLDLHDGLGGHLVNALAYMENKGVEDGTLRQALEDALQDLALMLDSLETEDSIATLLGMLRTRLETLLRDHGIEFIWQIADEPKLPKPGPSQNLTLLRVVQEAITNVVKHARASSITIGSNRTSITISDNGCGFDCDGAARKRRGHGILGMRKRASQIGADFQLISTATGTTIRLLWPEPGDLVEK
jgi:signal transduction histidine kinase